jgi:4-hydroxybenzoyl-CoA thioesterase
MPRTTLHRVQVEFGDCDPAQIAFYPNFFRWFDASAMTFFRECGVPAWRELEKSTGLIGTPIVEAGCKFLRPTTYGDRLEVHTCVSEWRDKSFVLNHQLKRDGAVLAEATEVRVFATRHPDDPARIKVVPVPADIRRLCE